MAQIIQNKDQAVAAAQRVIESQESQMISRRFEFEGFMNTIQEITPEIGGFDELAAMLVLPEETFATLAPEFLTVLERGMKNTSDQLLLVQSMNMLGMKAEDVREQYNQLFTQIETEMAGMLSAQKIDFLKRMLAITYNVLAEAEGVAKKNLLIPIEFCKDGARLPTYAHLTDSGMDVYALEDITIAPGETKLVPTGLKVAIPAGYELQVRPKSGRCLKTKLRVANTPGTIDAGYRDEIGIIIDNIEPFIKSAEMDENGRLYNVEFGSSYTIGAGEKFAQLVLCEVPKAVFFQVESVESIENDGRNGGFGSSGLK